MNTTQQTLEIAIQAHQIGNFKEAEHSYLSILHSDPDHTDANHNLGVLARQLYSAEIALPFLEKALGVNKNVEQYWISYIETLIEANYIDKASNTIDDAIQFGVNQERVVPLSTQIIEIKKTGQNILPEIKKLIELFNQNLDDQAEIKAKHLSKQLPKHFLPWKMLGVLHSRKKEWQQSLSAFLKVLEITPDDAETISNLATVQQELGMILEAKESSLKALNINPNFAQAHYNLGRALYKLDNMPEAETSYRNAIKLNPNYADAYCNLGLTLEGLGRMAEAIEAVKISLKLNPDLDIAQNNLGAWLAGISKYEEAEIELKKIKEINKDNLECLLKCYLYQNKMQEFNELTDTITKSGRISALLGSLINRAEIRYEKKIKNPYCAKPMDYLFEKNIYKDCDFENIFIKPLTEFINSLQITRQQGLLTNGKQSTGNLFILEKNRTEKIKKIIDIEIIKYREYFKDSKEGLIRKWPKKYKLYGWLVAMKSGGKLSAHMHETGWISGSIYINVPQKNKKDDGNIAFCIEEEKFLTAGQKGPEKIVDVNTGSICLFPSSLLHHTIPFDSEEERIVFAFDVQPDV
jgi:tetratricopeptide (TPR) repeat protein